MILNSPYISGSLTVTGNITAQGGINISGSIASASYAVSASEASKLQGLGSASFAPAATFNTVSQSYAASSASLSTRVTTNETNISTLTSASASFAVVSSSYAAASGSLSTRVTNVETTASVLTSASSSFATMSGSLSTRVTNLEATSSTVSQSFASTSGSISGRVTLIEGQYATTGSNNFTGPQYVSQASNAISFTSTASLYTDGGLRVSKDSFVSGTAYFNNVVVYGTSSIQYITSSQVNFGTNIITVNTDTPAVRFGGLAVFDSGSTQLTGSMLWDSEKNYWVYSNPSGSTYSGGMIISGPRNSGSLGSEQGTLSNYVMKGQGGDHITSSQIYTDDSSSYFYNNILYITASGNVGIGTSNPVTSLHISNAGNSFLTLQRTSPSVGTGKFGINIEGNSQTTTAYDCAASYVIGTSTDPATQAAFCERLRITNTGNVCVGGGLVVQQASNFCNTVALFGTSPYLYIGNSPAASDYAILGWCSTCQYLNIHQQSTGNGPQLVISCNGKVGVGTCYPSSVLNVSAIDMCQATTLATAYTAAKFRIDTYLTSGQGISMGNISGYQQYIQAQYQDLTTTNPLMLNPFGGIVGIGTGTNNPSSVQKLFIQSNNDQAGVTMYNSYDCNMWSLATGTAGVSNKGFAIRDEINNATRLQIDNCGNVGIGTLSPFIIAGINLSLNNAGSSAVQLGIAGTRTGQFYADSGEVRISAVTSVPLRLMTADTEKVRITPSGDIYYQFAGNKRWGVDYDYTGAYFYGLATNSNARALRIVSVAADALEGIYFQTGACFCAATTRMTITGAGYVGIGTSPTAQLHVCSAYSQTPLIVQGGGNGNVPIACFYSGPNQLALLDDNGNLIIGSTSFSTRGTASSNGLLVCGKVGIGNSSPKENFTIGDLKSVGGLAFCYFLMAQETWSTFACVTDGDTNVITDITYVNNNDFNRSGALLARWAYNATCAGLYITECAYNWSQNINTFAVRNSGGALQICISGGANGYKVQARVQGARATG